MGGLDQLTGVVGKLVEAIAAWVAHEGRGIGWRLVWLDCGGAVRGDGAT